MKKGDTIEPFLCLRRGVSIVAPFPAGTDYFSLPTQRCFQKGSSSLSLTSLFSAYAEVFLHVSVPLIRCCTFLCLRRGVSVMPPGLFLFFTFSLPTQWCFWVDRFDLRFTVLFSAYAEVFPTLRFFSTAVPAFLCLRRGVSTLHIVTHYTNSFSLPTQRCFH